MKQRRVQEIVLPLKADIPLHPSVTIDEKIIKAIELMVNHDLKFMTVVRKNRPIGMIYLEDAFQKVGLQSKPKN